ncbi:hypothetical protein [Absidia glauca]|uniref:Uncharacterized protein n=1 Tax=Absidia glauca TaxID=4829 RepID=A0A168NCN7_ABSGL|nr:hypothetical protein [Absidia glauca]
MMNSSPLVSALVNYTRVLQEARSPRVADWDARFVDRCVAWCVYIETELSLLSESDLLLHQQQAQHELDNAIAVPSVSILMDALHQFYLTLVANYCVSQDLYRYLLSTYRFLNGDGDRLRENVVEDLSRLARKVATHNVLDDMERLLMEDGDGDLDIGQDRA